MANQNDWENLPDDELEETALERLEGLKEMFPEGVRNAVCSTTEWGFWLTKSSFSLIRNTAWVISTSAFIMIMPYFIDKELQDMEKNQFKQQQQLLLGGGRT